jgi:CDP-6-deoxy-D-xylo-4-hexulose-3-dehydrase
MKKFFWKLQENIIDKKNTDILVKFIKKTKRYTQFTEVKKFEKAWSKWQGCKYSVFVNSGSSANLLILDLLKDLYNWQTNDEIIVPAVTWITDISSVMQLGLKPVFVDVNLTDFAFDYNQLAKSITKRTRAIFLTHLMGFPADINKIKKIIGKRKVALIEDCCESHGAKYHGKKIGNFGLVSSFSFYWGHHITTVEGGMICTNNEEIYKRAVLKRSHGLARELPPEYHDYYKKRYPTIDFNFLFLTTGYNVRNTELNAVLGKEQLKKLNSYIATRNRNFKKYQQVIKKFSEHLYTFSATGISSFSFPLVLKKAKLRDELQAYLTRKGIESRSLISGNLLKQPFLRKYNHLDRFPNADILHFNGFYIGNNQFVDKKRLDFLDKYLSEFFAKK